MKQYWPHILDLYQTEFTNWNKAKFIQLMLYCIVQPYAWIYVCRQDSNTEDNEAATAAQQSQAAAIVADSVAVEKDGAVTKRQHFAMNVNRPGYIVFSVSNGFRNMPIIAICFI